MITPASPFRDVTNIPRVETPRTPKRKLSPSGSENPLQNLYKGSDIWSPERPFTKRTSIYSDKLDDLKQRVDKLSVKKDAVIDIKDIKKPKKPTNRVCCIVDVPSPSKVDADPTYNKKSRVVGYFKTPFNADPESRIFLETLMWKIARIYGWEKRFAPTTEATLTIEGSSLRGTLQEAIDGILIAELIKNNTTDSIRFDSMIESTLIAAVLGTWDFHKYNGLVGADLWIYLFDNIRSLPHSNLFISRPDGKINSPLRIITNALPSSLNTLTNEEKFKVIAFLEDAKSRMHYFIAFLETPDCAEQIAKQPKNWFRKVLILQAMEERIDSILKAVKDNSAHNLVDATLASSEGYRIGLGCILATKMLQLQQLTVLQQNGLPTDYKFYQSIIGNLGYAPINADFKVFARKGFPVRQIVELCRETPVTFEGMVTAIRIMVETHRKAPPVNLAAVRLDNSAVLRELSDQAVPDWKDFTKNPLKKVELPPPVVQEDAEVLPTQLDIS